MSKQLSSSSKLPISAGKAVFIGHLIVTIPVFVIILGLVFIGLVLFVLFDRNYIWLLLVIGFVAGWLWWSFFVPRWRRWALKKGAPADELQKLGVMTGLGWPKGWIFEKTEFKVGDDE